MEPQLRALGRGSPPPCGEGLGVGAAVHPAEAERYCLAFADVTSLVGT